MALSDRKISTKPDPKRAEAEPQHSRGYNPRTGGYTTPAPKQQQPKGR